jgi:hypothetical protein
MSPDEKHKKKSDLYSSLASRVINSQSKNDKIVQDILKNWEKRKTTKTNEESKEVQWITKEARWTRGLEKKI